VARCATADRQALLPQLVRLGTPVRYVPGEATPTFGIAYDGDRREMLVEQLGDVWTPADIPPLPPISWAHVAPLARHEFPAETIAALARRCRVSLDGQGLVRVPEVGPLRLDGNFDPEVLRYVWTLKLADEEAEVLGDPAAVVQADGQFDQVLTLGVRRRVAPRLPAAVDLDGQVDVLTGAQCRSGSEHRVRFQRQRHAARGVAADGNDLGPGVAQCPGRLDELGVSVDPVGSGQQVDEGGAQHSIAEARLQRLSEHVYTVRSLPPIRQRFRAWLC